MNLNQTYNYYKDLNLQLHASSEVSNPYMFNITGNKSFKIKTINVVLLDKDTLLYYYEWIDDSEKETFKITIPGGVNVLKLEADIGQEGTDSMYGYIESQTNTVWINTGGYGYDWVSNSVYIKVTPGATYTITACAETTNKNINGGVYFYYSKSINSHTTNLSDLLS